MTKKIIELDELKRIMAVQKEYKENNKAITDARRNSMNSKKAFPLGCNVREDLYADLFTNGSVIKYPHGIVVQYGNNAPMKTFYRGEVKDYSRENSDLKCRSSLGRKLADLENEEERVIEFFVGKLKIAAFTKLIQQIKQWSFGTIFTYIIAQHYGIRTQYLDITDDLAVALFFACCKSVGNGKYKPVSKKDIKEKDFGLHAVLYKRADDFMMNLDPDKKLRDVLPIGYQPFTRCYKQRGYFIDTQLYGDIVNYDLVKNHGFKKFYFKRTPEFSKEIYDLFDGGKKLFHDQSMKLLSDVINDIKEANSFSEDSFYSVYDIFGRDKPKDWWQAKLSDYGIGIGETAFKLDDDLIAEIDDMWDIKEFVDQEGLAIGGRRVYYLE